MKKQNLTAEAEQLHTKNLGIISSLFGVEAEAVKGKSRNRKIFFCRLILALELKNNLISQVIIAELMNKNQCDVSYYVREVENCQRYSAEFKEMYKKFKTSNNHEEFQNQD